MLALRRFAVLILLGCLLSACRGGGEVVYYLSPPEAPEIWRVSGAGGDPRRLTDSGGRVDAYSVFPGGYRLVYAARNELAGLDLWLAQANNRAGRLLLDCGADRCTSPAVSPSGKQIVYARRNLSENPGGDAGLARLWLIDPASGETAPLYRDAHLTCDSPAWSPDGAWLSCYDFQAAAIRLHRLESGGSAETDLLLATPNPQPGSWAPDSAELIYSGIEYAAEAPQARLFRARLTQTPGTPAAVEIQLLALDLEALDFSPPVLSPDGKTAALSVLFAGGSAARALYLLDISGEAAAVVEMKTGDARSSTGACGWSPNGRTLACQQVLAGGAAAAPRVVLLDTATRSFTELAENAGRPAWAP